MKEIIVNNNTYLFIECLNDCKPEQIAYNIVNKPNSLIFDYSVQLISTTKDITEEQAESIVEKPEYDWYLTYTKGNMDSYHCQTAKESLQSLIQANGLDINKNYLIFKT
jgi:hypothetical protein